MLIDPPSFDNNNGAELESLTPVEFQYGRLELLILGKFSKILSQVFFIVRFVNSPVGCPPVKFKYRSDSLLTVVGEQNSED